MLLGLFLSGSGSGFGANVQKWKFISLSPTNETITSVKYNHLISIISQMCNDDGAAVDNFGGEDIIFGTLDFRGVILNTKSIFCHFIFSLFFFSLFSILSFI